MELLAGPWVGEFGHELFHWQGYLRTFAQYFDKVTCVGRTGHEGLYQDFCNHYINYDPVGEPDMFFLPTDDNEFKVTLSELFQAGVNEPKKTDLFWLKPNRFNKANRTLGFISDVEPSYIVYGKVIEQKSSYVVFHARNRPDRGLTSGMNWSQENWNLLAERWSDKYKILSIGTNEGSYYVDGTENRRGISLNETVDILRNAKAIVGPSSGPIHLATLCECPQVVWSGMSKNKIIYESVKNPFNISVNYFGEMGWKPSVDLVSQKMKEVGL